MIKKKKAIHFRNTLRRALKALDGIEDKSPNKQVKSLRKAVDETANFTTEVGKILPKYGISTETHVLIGDASYLYPGFMQTIVSEVVNNAIDTADKKVEEDSNIIDADFEEVKT